jgi:hypothetical protein
MNADELNALVNRITHTWPTGPRGHIWTSELCMLEAEPARHTYDRLVRTEHHPPTIARFLAEYRATTAPTFGTPTPEDTGPPTALDDVIARLERKHDNGTASDNDLTDLARWRRLKAESAARHPSCPNAPSST